MTAPMQRTLNQGGPITEPERVPVASYQEEIEKIQIVINNLKNTIPFSDDQANLLNNKEWEAHTLNVRDTLEHQERVAALSLQIADYYPKITRTERSLLFCAAMCHDIGKFELNPNIIFKPADLNDEEYQYVQTHAQLSSDIARRMNVADFNEMIARHNMHHPDQPLVALPDKPETITQLADLILEHHEHCDGKGYPLGKPEQDLSQLGKILTVTDVYDALTNPRVYRENGKVYSRDEAVKKMGRKAGTSFDMTAFSVLQRTTRPQVDGAKPLRAPEERWAPQRPARNAAVRIPGFFYIIGS